MSALLDLLPFTAAYRAIEEIPRLTERVKLYNDDHKIMEEPYPWLRGEHVHKGIENAINDPLATGSISKRVYFAGQFNYSETDVSAFQRVNAKALPAKSKPLKIQHKYIVWYVNLTPTDGQLGEVSGDHWCVLLLDFPDPRPTNDSLSIGTMLAFGKIDVRVRFFNPMGDRIPSAIKDTMQALLTTNLVGALGQAIQIDFNQVKMNAIVFEDLEWKYQTDTRQCGVWCVWMVQQLMLHGDLNSHENWNTPPDQMINANKKKFRELYFEKSLKRPRETILL